MEKPLSPKIATANSYLELAISLIAGTALALGVSWVLNHSSQFGLSIPPTQKLILSAFPVVLATAKWSAGQVALLRQKVEANSLQLTEQEKIKETLARLDREVLWSKIQIENLYSRLEELEDKD
jgi:hypothetical protein